MGRLSIVGACVGIGAGAAVIASFQSKTQAAGVGDFVCRMSWGFPAGDKIYSGEGKTQSLAEQDAHIKCAQDQALSQYKAICGGAPKTLSCNQVAAPPPAPTEPAPAPRWCVKPRDPGDAARVKQLPLHSVLSDDLGSGSAADPGNNAYPTIDLPAGKGISNVYCRMEDFTGEGWCADTPYDPKGCDFWAWTLPPNNWYPRAEWVKNHWRIRVGFHNQSDNRKRRFQIYAE